MIHTDSTAAVCGLKSLVADCGYLIVNIRLRDFETLEFNVTEVDGVVVILEIGRVFICSNATEVILIMLKREL